MENNFFEVNKMKLRKMKLRTMQGRAVQFDALDVQAAVEAVWMAYEKSGDERLAVAHTIVACAAYGRIE